MARVVVDRVTKRFGATTALQDVSVSVEHGEFLVLLGPSGCGKSTLLRMIAGLADPTEGRIIVGDRDVTALSPRDRDVAMVFQGYALYPHLTVRRNLDFGLRVRHGDKEETERAVTRVATQLRLTELLERRPKELSGGQRQRVALGRAIVRDPAVFLMDEPLSNLDAQLRTATRLELAELHRRLGATFVYVTHDQVEAMTMATRIAVLSNGHLEQVGTPAEIYDEPATAFVASFIGSPSMNLVPAVASSVDGRVRVSAHGVDLPLVDGELPAQDVTLGVRPEHLRVARPDEPAALAGRVADVENLGHEELAFVSLGTSDVVARGPRPLGLVPGDEVRLAVDPGRAYLFDPSSGRRLVWEGAERSASRPLAHVAAS